MVKNASIKKFMCILQSFLVCAIQCGICNVQISRENIFPCDSNLHCLYGKFKHFWATQTLPKICLE